MPRKKNKKPRPNRNKKTPKCPNCQEELIKLNSGKKKCPLCGWKEKSLKDWF